MVRRAIQSCRVFIFAALVLMVVGLLIASGIGTEFIPRLSEMGIVINTVRLSGVSLEESVRYGTQMEKIIVNSNTIFSQNV